MAQNAISDDLKFKIFLGGMPPDPPSMSCLCWVAFGNCFLIPEVSWILYHTFLVVQPPVLRAFRRLCYSHTNAFKWIFHVKPTLRWILGTSKFRMPFFGSIPTIKYRSLENFWMKLFQCEKIHAKNFCGWPNPTKFFNTKFLLI